MSKLHIYAFLIKIMSMNFHNMEYLSNINNIYKYIHNPYECWRGQRRPYSDSDNFGAYTLMDRKVNRKPARAPTQVPDPKLLKMENLPCDYHLIESRVKRRWVLCWWKWTGWRSHKWSKVLRGLSLVGLAVDIIDLAKGDWMVVVLHPGEPARNCVVVVPLARTHLRLSWNMNNSHARF